MAEIPMPAEVAASKTQSALWKQLTAGRTLSDADIPAMSLLCFWHDVARQCREDMATNTTDLNLAYDTGESVRATPYASTLKQASSEIRALSDQLGVTNKESTQKAPPRKEATLYALQSKRKSRNAKAVL